MGFWVLIVAIAVNLALSLVILTRATRASSTAYFGISALFIAFWGLGTLLLLYGTSIETANVGLMIFLVAPLLTTLYMVLFSKYFSEVGTKGRLGALVSYTTVAVIFGAITLVQVPGSHVVVTINGIEGNRIDLQFGWYLFYSMYFSLMFVASYAYLLFGILRSKGRVYLQRRLVFVGIAATSSLALATNVALPLLGYSGLIWLGPACTVFYILTTCYAMIKHGLFDLRLALVLTFTYALSLATLTILYYIIALTISAIFIQDGEVQGVNGLNLAIALLLAFLFQPIRKFFDKFTSSVFYQDSYRVDAFFAELSKTLSSTNNLHILLQRAVNKISQTLKAEDASFVIYTGEGRTEQMGVGKYARLMNKDIEWLDNTLRKGSVEPVVLTLLDDDEEDLRRMMISHRTAIILPIIGQGEKLGYLFLGEHKRSGYSARDLRVVRALADELAIAIQNALSVEQIRELNGHLEQRISAATKELRANNVQLQRLDEAKDEFISMASHQLRTPLTSIKGYLSMLIDGDVGAVTKEQKHLLNEAFVSSERMVRLIGDFLNVSRLQTGKFVIDKHPVDLALLVQREIDGLEQNAAARGVKFVYKRPKNIPTIELDENKIQQVVMNFSDNAIYYSKEKSKISVELKKTDEYVEFTVTDTGIGVPAEEQSQLFNKFFRATNARRARPDGTGVGLFLAKKVIDDHGGKILFESEEGKGSTFGFRLPIPKSKR